MKRRHLVFASLFVVASVHSWGQTGSKRSFDGLNPWPMDHANPARTGKTWAIGPSSGNVEWSRKTWGGTFGIACDHTGGAILGATFKDEWWAYDVYTTRYDANGNIVWKNEVTPYDWGASQAVNSFPALDGKTKIYMNSTNSQLLRFNHEGTLENTIQNDASFVGGSSPAVLSDGTLFLIHALSLKKVAPSGNLIWQNSISSQTDIAISPNFELAAGGVKTNEPHGSVDLTYYNADGSTRWIKTSTRGSRPQVCFDEQGFLYIGNASYNPDGSARWIGTFGGWGACLDGLGRVLVPSGNFIYCYDRANGTLLWTHTLGGTSNIREGLSIDGNNKLYYTTSDGYFGCVLPNGTRLFHNKICDNFTSQPSISTRQRAYAVGQVGFNNYFLFKLN